MLRSHARTSAPGYEPNSQPTAQPRPVLNEERISAVNFSNSRPWRAPFLWSTRGTAYEATYRGTRITGQGSRAQGHGLGAPAQWHLRPAQGRAPYGTGQGARYTGQIVGALAPASWLRNPYP